MNSPDFKQNICRICLDESVALDWNTTLYGYCDITYKDCFYKYTQLECCVLDRFSPMLCQICLNGLYNTHTLILKALESHKYLQDTNPTNLMVEHSVPNKKDDIKYTPTEFEIVLMEKSKIEPIMQDHFVYQNSVESIIKPVKTKAGKTPMRCRKTTSVTAKQERYKNKMDKSVKTEKNESSESKKSQRKSTAALTKQVVVQHNNICEKLESGTEMIADDIFDDSGASQVEHKDRKRYNERKKPRMCSICSKILHNIYAVRMHEKTHMENRERKETCKVCGLKFYDKRNLYTHKRIHVENREKNHKCDFCNKAFYNKGGLNIHRRIHLGQMIPCNLCTKEFFRQIDLERHMTSHSATTINSETKKRSRYFVRCKHCGKSILSTSFKSHTAAHLNDPLMKCSICSKEFFRRGSCVLHVKKVHQKTNEDYNDFIIQYKKNRISHLFLEQKADIQFAGQ